MNKAMTYRPAAAPETQSEPGLDIQGIIADLRRYSKLFGGVFALVFAFVLAVTLTQTPKYTATASLLIGDDYKQTLPGQLQMPDQPIDQSEVESEVELIKSPAVAERVINTLGLDKDAEFNPALGKPSLIARIKGAVSAPFRKMAAHEAGLSSADIDTKMARQSIVESLQGNLRVNRVGLTRVVEVSVASTDKAKAADIANSWAEQYIVQKLATAESANKQQTDFLATRIDGLRKQVEEAERTVQQYKINHNLLSAEGATLTEAEISDLNKQLAAVRVDQAEAAARLSTVRRQLASGSHGDDVSETLNSPVIANLRQQASQYSGRLADLETRYGPLHPEVVKVKQQLNDTNRQIDAEIRRIVSSLNAQNNIQTQRASSLVGSVSRAQGQLATNSKAMVELKQLETNADSVRALYESYLDRLKQTVTGAGGQNSNARVAANAAIPSRPSSPKFALSVLIALVAGSLAGGGAVAVRRAFDSSLTIGYDVERKLGIHYLAGIPELATTLDPADPQDMTPFDYIRKKRLSAFSESFRNLRVALFHSGPRKAQMVAITSALPGEGKTTTSACLAITLAMSGEKVCIVDCDLRRHSLNSVFNLAPDKGLVEILEGTATLEDALVVHESTGLHVLPLSGKNVDSRDLFDIAPIDKLLADLRSRYDIIILDTAPVLPVAETRLLAQKADAVALLVRWRSTPLKAAQRAVDLLKGVDVNFAGAALTQININDQTKYGYGDTEYFFKTYKAYYQS